jgi:hypothetical protein
MNVVGGNVEHSLFYGHPLDVLVAGLMMRMPVGKKCHTILLK